MTIPVEVLRTHLRYSSWASKRLVAAASGLTADELTRDFKSADKSVLGTLVHIHAADRVWLGRIEGNPPARFMDPDVDLKLAVVQRDWPLLLDRWEAWAAALRDPSEAIRYKDLRGNAHSTPLWQVVLHVVNHATHHRGQVAAMLRAMDHAPPPLDLILYFRETAAGGSG